MYKYTFIDKYFIHPHKIAVDELAHTKDYGGCNFIFHWFDLDLELDDLLSKGGLAIVLVT